MSYIGLGRRFVSWLIDSLITGLAWVAFADTESANGTYSIAWRGADFVLPTLITLAYFVVLEGTLGATIGKLVVGIRVREPDGSRIGLGRAAARNLARIVDAFPYVIPYLVGAIAVSRSPTKQRLGDRWAGTVVILMGTQDGTGTASDGSRDSPGTARGPAGLPSPPPGAPSPEPAPRVPSAGLPPPPPSS